MRHNVTPINGENELLAFTELMFGNYLMETTLGCHPARPTPNHQTCSWVSFFAKLIEMKHVQYIVTIVAVAVATTIAIVKACRMIHVKTNCGTCISTDQRHRMAQERVCFD